jgi:hypothetical protein
LKTLDKDKYENYMCRQCKRTKNKDSNSEIASLSDKSSISSLSKNQGIENKKMGFGKYRSMTYKTVYETQKSYIRWFIGEIRDCKGAVEDFKKWLYEKEGLCLGCEKKIEETGTFMARCGFEVCLKCYARMECDDD